MKLPNAWISILLALTLLLSLSGCTLSSGGAVTAYLPEEDYGELWFYGIEKQGGVWYAKVLQEPQQAPGEVAFLYVPLAEELYAEFQPTGWVGGWSPDQFWTPKELQNAVQKEKISLGILFTYSMTDGQMDYLVQYNYYEGNDVTGGAP